jgi:hypothetical protein
MRIGVADSAGADADQNFSRADFRNCDFGTLQGFAELHKADGRHRSKRSTLNSEHSISK